MISVAFPSENCSLHGLGASCLINSVAALPALSVFMKFSPIRKPCNRMVFSSYRFYCADAF
jgi:hypothetical protein